MKEFLEALSVTLVFVLSGYVLFGSLGKTEPSTETMDMGSMDIFRSGYGVNARNESLSQIFHGKRPSASRCRPFFV